MGKIDKCDYQKIYLFIFFVGKKASLTNLKDEMQTCEKNILARY